MASMVVEPFIMRQLEEWPLAAKNYKALANVELKSLEVAGFPMKVQHNPARIISTGALVDSKSIASRPCFLCGCNRPPEQRSLRHEDYEAIPEGYEILVNPYPIFHSHLTIVSQHHEEQMLGNGLSIMIRLAGALEGFTIFYNGAACGASAPDHKHFQAAPSDYFPIWEWIDKGNRHALDTFNGSTIYVIDGLPFDVLYIEADGAYTGRRLLEETLRHSRKEGGMPAEPMMNILCRKEGGITQCVVILRKRHRPSFYPGADGKGVMISPASVDLAGVWILPRKEDFDIIDESIIDNTIREVVENNLEYLKLCCSLPNH